MRFLHAADLHLDTPFVGISDFSKELQTKLKASTYESAQKLFRVALEQKVDFVILAGDIFDDTDSSLKAQMFLKSEFEKLNQANIKVFMVYGNHDYYRSNFSVIDFPDNVTIFGKEPTEKVLTAKDGQKVGIAGFSYYQQHIVKNLVQEYPERDAVDYQIGILHAGVGDNNYAPFQINDLLKKGYDYWALGHIHKREILNEKPMIVYPGDIQGRNQNETTPKGFYLVTVENTSTQIKFVQSSVYTWEKASLNATTDDTVDSLITKIQQLLNKPNTLLTLTIENAQNLNADVVKTIERNELKQHIQTLATPGILYKISQNYNSNPQLATIDQKYWDEAEQKAINLDDIKDLDSRLYSSDIIREHISQPDFLERIVKLTKNAINQKYTGE
jgi:DNA repair exonuclease